MDRGWTLGVSHGKQTNPDSGFQIFAIIRPGYGAHLLLSSGFSDAFPYLGVNG